MFYITTDCNAKVRVVFDYLDTPYWKIMYFLDTQVSLAPTHVRCNLADPNITLLIRHTFEL